MDSLKMSKCPQVSLSVILCHHMSPSVKRGERDSLKLSKCPQVPLSVIMSHQVSQSVTKCNGSIGQKNVELLFEWPFEVNLNGRNGEN